MAAPRKLTIKLRPVGAKPAVPAATAPAAPTPAPAPAPVPPPAPEAPVVEEMTPVVDTPSTPTPEVKVEAPEVKVEAPEVKAEAPEAKVETPEVTVTTDAAQQAKRQTSRIELPPELTSAPMNAQEATTIRLKPISQTATPATEDAQASKSKTARIALDSVLGGIQANTPLANTTQKTIKLKRAAAPATAGKSTTSTPMASAPSAGEDDKTIKLNKRPAGISIKKPTLGLKKPITLEPKPAATDDGLENLETLESLDDMPSAPMMGVPPVEAESGAQKIFTIIGSIAAAGAVIIGIMLWFTMHNQACSPDGSEPTGNTLHSFSMKQF